MAIRAPIAAVGKQAAIYGVGNVFTKLAAFLLIPIYTRYMSMTEVGILALFSAMLGSPKVNALMSNEKGLSNEFKEKASTIFEAAVHAKVVDELNTKLEEIEGEKAKEDETRTNSYAEGWIRSGRESGGKTACSAPCESFE